MKRVCQYCGKTFSVKRSASQTCHECSKQYKVLLNKNNSKIRHEKPKHTSEELEAIKKKYAAGVPAGEIERMVKEFVK